MFAVTKDIQEAKKIVNVRREISRLKRCANRRHRRARHRHERALMSDVHADARSQLPLSGWDLA